MYFVTFIAEFSRYVLVTSIARKNDAAAGFKKFHVWFERKFDCKIKGLHYEGDGEYISLDDYLLTTGIELDSMPPYTPELNGSAERMNRTLVGAVRLILQRAKMPQFFWAEAVAHIADLRNRMTSRAINTATAYELVTGKNPRLDRIRLFGSLSFAHVPQEKRKKLDDTNRRGIVVACNGNSQHKIWCPSKREPFLSRHVKILENEFPPRDCYTPDEDVTEFDVQSSTNPPVTSTDGSTGAGPPDQGSTQRM